MPNLSTLDYSSLYCLFKGEPGTRKSTAALSFPKPIYWFDWDQKMDALGLPMKAWNINPIDVDYDLYDDWDKAKIKLESLAITCKYKTIVIDSITSASDAMTRQVMRTKGSDNKGKMVGGLQVEGLEEFNAESGTLKELIALTKALKASRKINIILIAHVIQTEQKSVDGKTHMSRTLVTAAKKIAQKIPAYCSEVYHFNIKQGAIVGKGGQYAVLTTHTGDDFARTSLPLDEEIVFGNDPLYDKWIKPAIIKITDNPPSVLTQPPQPPQQGVK